jgi:hypothetical protein
MYRNLNSCARLVNSISVKESHDNEESCPIGYAYGRNDQFENRFNASFGVARVVVEPSVAGVSATADIVSLIYPEMQRGRRPRENVRTSR